MVDYSPPGGVDLHRPPSRVAEVEKEPTVQTANPDMDNTFGAIEMRLGLDDVERRLKCLGTWCALRRFEELARQPPAEALGADRPSLPMAVDVEVREACAVRRVEQFRRSRQVNQNVGLLRSAPIRITVLLRDRTIKRVSSH